MSAVRCTSVSALLCAGLGLAGCASPPGAADYAQEQPPLALETFLSGPLTAHGLFLDRAGQVQRRFSVALQGHWTQGPDGQPQGRLEEQFTYLDAAHRGQTQQRVWRLRRLGESQGLVRYEGRADDVVGTAEGELAGNTLHWRYRLRLPVDGHEIEVDMDDWMVLMTPGLLLNHTVMSKWGVRLGEVQITFAKRD
ncbi:MAG: DUF3833 domain-containing protein [Curvibacter sp.]|nr:DUF3833 domain-containing protein [Curvibacter sp.]